MTAIPVEFAQGAAGTDAWPISDATDREKPHYCTTVTASGDTTLITPTAGKRLRVHWMYAINDPTASSAPIIKVIIGTTEKYCVYALSKRQQFTGATDEVLKINLSATGSVAVTVIYEEIT